MEGEERNEKLTEGSSPEGRPSLHEISAAGNHRNPHSITNHHNISLLLLQLHVLFVHPLLYVYNVPPRAVARRSIHRLVDRPVPPTAIRCHHCIGAQRLGIRMQQLLVDHHPGWRVSVAVAFGAISGWRVRYDAAHLLVHHQQVAHELCHLRYSAVDVMAYATVGAVEALQARVLVAERGAEPCPEVCFVVNVAVLQDDPADLFQRPTELVDGVAKELDAVMDGHLLAEVTGNCSEARQRADGAEGFVDGAPDGAVEYGDRPSAPLPVTLDADARRASFMVGGVQAGLVEQRFLEGFCFLQGGGLAPLGINAGKEEQEEKDVRS